MGNRVREVSLLEATPETRAIYKRVFGDRDPIVDPGTATGTRGDYWTTLALVPDLFHWSSTIFFSLLDPDRALPGRLRELAILRTAIMGDCLFEYSQHCKAGRRPENSRGGGLTQDEIDAVKSWTTSDLFDSRDRAVMGATDQLLGYNRIEDATFAELKRHLEDHVVVELLYVIAMYRAHGLMIRALHVEFDTDTTCRLQEVEGADADWSSGS